MLNFLRKQKVLFGDKLISVGDINASFLIKTSVKNMSLMLQTIKINSYDTPQSVAHTLYGDARLDWVVLYAANITNEFNDWPKDNDDVWRYCEKNYSDGPNGIHHYERIDGGIVDHYTQQLYRAGQSVPANTNVITNYVYEMQVNDLKKTINVFSKNTIHDIVNRIEEVLK